MRVAIILILFSALFSPFIPTSINADNTQDGAVKPAAGKKQENPPQEDTEELESIKIGSEVVLVNVLVTDEKNRYVERLTKEEFEIYEDGRKQELSFFAKQDEPISLAILIDGSTSMVEGAKIDEARKAVRAILSTSNPKDEAFLMKFDNGISILQEFTSDFDLLKSQVERIKPFGGTALNDAIIKGLVYAKKNSKRVRQALIMITDGLDQHSKNPISEVLQVAQLTGIPCYFIGLYTPQELQAFATGQRIKLEGGGTAENPTILLRQIAEETAGRAFFPATEFELPTVAKQIVDELRSAYALGYYPPTTSLDGKYHTIQVSSKSKKFIVRARRGYISKLEN